MSRLEIKIELISKDGSWKHNSDGVIYLSELITKEDIDKEVQRMSSKLFRECVKKRENEH